ncbi:MAG: respiratory chain complex I subunit 1 family protein [Mycobacterium leprae]
MTTLSVLAQLLLFLAFAPLVNGVIKKTKARLQRRVGPPVYQPYNDLRKYFRKSMVISPNATWLFHVAPFIHGTAIMTAALILPVFGRGTGLRGVGAGTWPFGHGGGDVLLLVGLLALGRVFMALSALESGSAFGGMGSSREMAVSVFVEPTLLLTLGVFVLQAHTTNLEGMAALLAGANWAAVPGHWLAAAALLVVTVAETGRIPVDNPDTHLELTMIHEAGILEYSGPYLGLIVWAHDMKQLIMLALLAGLALPFGTVGPLWLVLPLFLAKTLLLGVLLACIEFATAKVRILKIPDLLITAAALSLLAALSLSQIGG